MRSTGTVYFWGQGFASDTPISTPAWIESLSGVTRISAGRTPLVVAEPHPVAVPDLTGMTRSIVHIPLQRLGLVLGEQLNRVDTPTCARVGEIAATDPPVGSQVAMGTAVKTVVWVKPGRCL